MNLLIVVQWWVIAGFCMRGQACLTNCGDVHTKSAPSRAPYLSLAGIGLDHRNMFLHSHAWFWGLWKLDELSSMSISFNISIMFSVKAKADFSSFPGGSHWWFPLVAPWHSCGDWNFQSGQRVHFRNPIWWLKIIPARDPKQCGGVEG